MTNRPLSLSIRPAAFPALAVAALLALGTGTALSRPSAPVRAPAAPPRVAVLAGADASATAIADATSGATPRVVRRVGGLQEARAQAAALAAQDYDAVVAVGPQARAALAEARGAELHLNVR